MKHPERKGRCKRCQYSFTPTGMNKMLCGYYSKPFVKNSYCRSVARHCPAPPEGYQSTLKKQP